MYAWVSATQTVLDPETLTHLNAAVNSCVLVHPDKRERDHRRSRSTGRHPLIMLSLHTCATECLAEETWAQPSQRNHVSRRTVPSISRPVTECSNCHSQRPVHSRLYLSTEDMWNAQRSVLRTYGTFQFSRGYDRSIAPFQLSISNMLQWRVRPCRYGLEVFT